MKFGLRLTQVLQGGLQLRASPLTISGNEGGGIVLGGAYQFMVEGRGGHLACGVAGNNQTLCGQVESLSRAGPTDSEKQRNAKRYP